MQQSEAIKPWTSVERRCIPLACSPTTIRTCHWAHFAQGSLQRWCQSALWIWNISYLPHHCAWEKVHNWSKRIYFSYPTGGFLSLTQSHQGNHSDSHIATTHNTNIQCQHRTANVEIWSICSRTSSHGVAWGCTFNVLTFMHLCCCGHKAKALCQNFKVSRSNGWAMKL